MVTIPSPKRILSTRDGIVMIVGLVVGAGIFRSSPLVAANSASETMFLLLWVVGGAIALVGALCYAELASTHPHTGGEYHILGKAFGPPTAFMLGWSRLTVMQTGSIAMLAFLFADYATRLLPVSASAAAIVDPLLAMAAILVFTVINAAGLQPGTRSQYLLTGAEFTGLIIIVVAGFAVAGMGSEQLVSDSAAAAGTGTATATPPSSNIALALVFVLLTYGGWSEAAYLSAELRDEQRGVQRTLAWGVTIVTVLYLIVNLAYLRALGLPGVAASTAVAVDIMQLATGEWGAIIVGIIVMAAALSSMNATMITGARGTFAVSADIRPLRALGVWHPTREHDSGAPRRALVAQAIISLILVGFGAATRAGFETMVAYTAPVFWLTLFLMGVALFVLRQREPERHRPFRVPFYPILPMLFCLTSAWMCYSSIAYAGIGALFGVVVMLAGIPVFLFGRTPAHQSTPSSNPSTNAPA